MTGARLRAQALALLAGALFLLLGLLGLARGGGDAHLLGTFAVSILLNVVHLAFGALGVVLARRESSARAFLLGGGVAALALWLVGAAAVGGWIPLNPADNWLHLLAGAAMLLALFPGREDLGDDLERDLGGGLAAELQPDGPAD